MKPLHQSSPNLEMPQKGIKSQLVRDSMSSSGLGVRSFLAWNVSIGLLFASIAGAGLYQPEYVMSFGLQEGNTEQEVFDEEMGGAVMMQLEEEAVETLPEEAVEEAQPELVEETPPEPEPEPEPELVEFEPVQPIEPLTTEAVFKVETPEPILENIKEEKKPEPKVQEKPKPRPRPRPQTLPASPRPQTARAAQTAPSEAGVRSSSVGSSGGASGTGRGLRLGGRGAKGKFPAPPYPAFARKMGAQGSVTVAITVNDAGSVTGVRILRSSGFQELDSYACNWIQNRWRWPAGQSKTYRQPVLFRLR